MQVSQQRLAANRANALKSTGPKTDAGKRRSSRNACKHHIYGRKFRMPDVWEHWTLQRAYQFAQNIDDPDLRPLIFQRVLINGRQKYFVHLCAEFFKKVRQNGMPWYFANCDYITALDRYHAHHYAETLRITRLLRRYYANRKLEPRAVASGCGQPKPKSIAAGQTLFSRPNEPISRTHAPATRPARPTLPCTAATALFSQADQTHLTRAAHAAAARLTTPRPPPYTTPATSPEFHRASSRSP